MSEKERQKKDGRNKDKKNQAMRERGSADKGAEQSSSAARDKDKPATYGEGLPRNDQREDAE